MVREVRGILARPHREDPFIATCKNILLAELWTLYTPQLANYTLDIIEQRIDTTTLPLLRDGTLPMPIKRGLPEKVWYFKACYLVDKSKRVELLIGQYEGLPRLLPLGMHDGQKWTYAPLAINKSWKLSN